MVILENVLQPNKTGPSRAVFQDIIMLVRTSGHERSVDEYKLLVENEGFNDFQFTPLEGSSSFDVIVARKVKT